MPNVFIVGFGGSYQRMYEDNGFTVVNNLDDADLVQFTGGEDVSPHLYGQDAHPYTGFNTQRDVEEERIYLDALKKDKPMVGICRGGQFLNVMNGGDMYQHVNNHALRGTHVMKCIRSSKEIEVSSTHHQMMRPNDKGEILGIANLATFRHIVRDGEVVNVLPEEEYSPDIEIVYYADTRSLCFQPHPEIMSKLSDCQKYFFELVLTLLLA